MGVMMWRCLLCLYILPCVMAQYYYYYNYENDGCTLFTQGGSSNGMPCADTFTATDRESGELRTYTGGCTTDAGPLRHYEGGDWDGQSPWCSTTADFDFSGSWAYCLERVCLDAFNNEVTTQIGPICGDSTINPNGGVGPACALPFTYNGVSRNRCTNVVEENIDYFFCCTDANCQNGRAHCGYGRCKAPPPDATAAPPPVTVQTAAPPTGTYCPGITSGGTNDGAGCEFPFMYLDNQYSECITVGDASPWCSSTFEYTRLWGYCVYADENGVCPGTNFCHESGTYGGTASGASCVFPFTFKGVQYSDCTYADGAYNLPWCATTSIYSDSAWGYCYTAPCTGTGLYCPTSTSDGNSFGAACAASYVYEGVQYTSADCIAADAGAKQRSWCATNADMSLGLWWGYCNNLNNECADGTECYWGSGATYDGYCVFPFEYKGFTFYSCTLMDSLVPWCYTTSDFNLNYGLCLGSAVSCPSQPVITDAPVAPVTTASPTDCKVYTYGGKADGAECVFPFIYNGQQYDTCIYYRSHTLWCGTTSNYDQDKMFSYCEPGDCSGIRDPPCPEIQTYDGGYGNANGAPCVFPFEYNGEMYSGCSMEAATVPWCAVTHDYPNDKRWGYCHIPTAEPGTNCVFPFYLGDNVYTSCTQYTDSVGSWCGLEENVQLGVPGHQAPCVHYGSCIPAPPTIGLDPCTFQYAGVGVNCTECNPINSDGGECVFPFLYRNEWYYECSIIPGFSSVPACGTQTSAQSVHPCFIPTKKGKTCGFPFFYEGEEIHSCTTRDSSNGAPWCVPDGLTASDWEHCDRRECTAGQCATTGGYCPLTVVMP